ncbi:hypothetical protein BGZ51_003334 [Haplosporangium sp. Z 767]|nr:hypothetical protein BGZ51_003334 [Haplosporangium sp. Z 767]KAF9185076.1 hypothetical protein BGZ50_003284 [Haplosporangium sp. Z 11]
MDHGGGHGGHGGGHDGHDGGDSTCDMNMVFNWATKNLCVVFESWKINTPLALVVSCIVIIGMSASYELLRAQSRQYEERLLEGARKRYPSESSTHNVGGNGSNSEDETPLLSNRPHVMR